MSQDSSSDTPRIEQVGHLRNTLWGQAVSVTADTRLHAHSMHELVVGLGAGGAQHVVDTGHEFQLGRVFFLPEGLPHRVSAQASAPARFCYVCFEHDHFAKTGKTALQAVVDDWTQRGIHAPALPFELRVELSELAQRLVRELRQVHALGQAMADALLTEIIVKAQRQLTAPDAAPAVGTNDSLETICEAISADPEQTVTLDGMARRAGMSRSVFARAFRQHTGMTLLAYTMATRVQAARRYLESSELSVGEIAGRVGFANLGHFHATFKRETGMTPRQYRLLSEAQGASQISDLQRIS